MCSGPVAGPQDPATQLTVPDGPQEIVSAGLLRAMVAAKRARPDQQQMSTWVTTNSPSNATEAVGLLRWSMSLRAVDERQLLMCIETLNSLSRAKCRTRWPAVAAAVVSWINRIMSLAWQRAKNSHVSLPSFVALHRESLAYVFDVADAEAVLKAPDSDMSSVSQALHRLVDSGTCGAALFSQCLIKLVSASISAAVDKCAEDFAKGPGTSERLSQFKLRGLKDVELLPNVQLAPPRREISFRYGAETYTAVVGSVADELVVKLSAVFKASAEAAGLLQPLSVLDGAARVDGPQDSPIGVRVFPSGVRSLVRTVGRDRGLGAPGCELHGSSEGGL